MERLFFVNTWKTRSINLKSILIKMLIARKVFNRAIERPFAASLSCLKRSTVGLWNEPDSFLYTEGKSHPCA